MTLAHRFRSLTPQLLQFQKDPYAEKDFGSGLISLQSTGLDVETSEADEIVSITARITSEEVKQSMNRGIFALSRAVLANAGMEVDEFNEAKEVARFAWFTQGMELGMGPKSSCQEVFGALDPRCPHLLVQKKATGEQGGTFRRILGVTAEGLTLECDFRDEQLVELRMLDLHRQLQNAPLEDIARAQREVKRAELLATAASSPLSVLRRCFVHLPPAEEVEWSRDFPTAQTLEPQSATDEDDFDPSAMDEGMPYCEPVAEGFFSKLKSKLNPLARLEAEEAAGNLGVCLYHRAQLEKKYGTLATMLSKVPEEKAIVRGSNWFLWTQGAEIDKALKAGLMAEHLEDLHRDITQDDGLGTWLECRYATDTGDLSVLGSIEPLLQAIGATELLAMITELASQVKAIAGSLTGDHWRDYFEDRDTTQMEKQAFALAQRLPGQYIAWTRANGAFLAEQDARVRAIAAQHPVKFRTLEAMQDQLLGLGGMLGAGLRGMQAQMNQSLNELESMAGMEDVDTSELHQMAAFSPPPAPLAPPVYASLREALTQAPDMELLRHAASFAGQPGAAGDAAAMAARINDFVNGICLSALDYWLSGEGVASLRLHLDWLQTLGSDLAEPLRRLGHLAWQAVWERLPDFDVVDFCDNQADYRVAEETFETRLDELPALFRSYWMARL